MKNTRFIWMTSATAGLAIALAGCQGAPTSNTVTSTMTSSPDQSHVCEVQDWKAGASAALCHPGQKIVFLPESWGNEQLPILFVAVNCDMRYSVALTVGGASCIYAGSLAPDKVTKGGASASNPSTSDHS